MKYLLWSSYLIVLMTMAAKTCFSATDVDRQLSILPVIFADPSFVHESFALKEGETAPRGLNLYLWQGDRKTTPLFIPFSDLGKPVNVPPDEDIILFKDPFIEDDLENHPQIAAKIRVSSDATRMILVLVPRDIQRREFNVALIDISPEAMEANTVQVINLSDKRVGLALGDGRAVLERGTRHFFHYEPSAQSTMFLLLAREESDGNLRYSSQRIRAENGARMITLLSPENRGSGIRITTFTDL